MLEIVPSNQFKKDLKTAKKRGFKLEHLTDVINTLAKQIPLDAKFRDHSLAGSYKDFRECHVEPDWRFSSPRTWAAVSPFSCKASTASEKIRFI